MSRPGRRKFNSACTPRDARRFTCNIPVALNDVKARGTVARTARDFHACSRDPSAKVVRYRLGLSCGIPDRAWCTLFERNVSSSLLYRGRPDRTGKRMTSGQFTTVNPYLDLFAVLDCVRCICIIHVRMKRRADAPQFHLICLCISLCLSLIPSRTDDRIEPSISPDPRGYLVIRAWKAIHRAAFSVWQYGFIEANDGDFEKLDRSFNSFEAPRFPVSRLPRIARGTIRGGVNGILGTDSSSARGLRIRDEYSLIFQLRPSELGALVSMPRYSLQGFLRSTRIERRSVPERRSQKDSPSIDRSGAFEKRTRKFEAIEGPKLDSARKPRKHFRRVASHLFHGAVGAAVCRRMHARFSRYCRRDDSDLANHRSEVASALRA